MSSIGIIGEDRTDVETLQVIVRRLVPKGVGIPVRAPSKGGCAALRRRAAAFMKDLHEAGCSAVVFLHDLDLNNENNEHNDEPVLRAKLARIDIPAGLERHICIPIEEIEAWFWSDQNVLDKVGRGAAKAMTSPHTLKRPKEMLGRISRRVHGRNLYCTNMNQELASILDLTVCASRCPAFAELREFVGSVSCPSTSIVIPKAVV